MKIENSFSDKELQLISPDETPIVSLKQESPESYDSITHFNLVITEKRIYTYQYNNDTEIKNIINIEKVEFVNFEKKTTQKNFGVPLFLAILLIIPAVFFSLPCLSLIRLPYSESCSYYSPLSYLLFPLSCLEKLPPVI